MNTEQQELIALYFNTISQSGFLPPHYYLDNTEIEISTDITSYTAYKLILRHKNVPRELHFNITDYYSHCRVFISIHNTDGKSHNLLSVVDYLEKFCNIKDAKNKNLLSLYEGNNDYKKFDSFLIWLKETLDKRFFKILDGEDWEEISFNWGTYK